MNIPTRLRIALCVACLGGAATLRRGGEEFAAGHLPGALNIPHTEVRGRLDEIREAADGRPVRVMCLSGMRSYLAHRQLAQAGFDSANLSGGMLTLRASIGPAIDDLLVVEATDH